MSPGPLAGPQTVAMIFDKPTLRTQASFAAGIAELGGHPMLVDGKLAGIGVREQVSDVARVLGRQASAIVWRTFEQSRLEEMAEHAGVPVVNALTDQFHPCQLLADLLTVSEHKGRTAGLTVTFVGDGASNMGSSWLLAGATAGMEVRISSPDGYQPDPQVLDEATRIADGTDGSVALEPDPWAAVAGADVVVTDTWVSMGTEEEGEARTESFRDFSVTSELFAAGEPGRDRHALPTGLPRQGDRRRGDRRPAQRRLGRGGEPPTRPEGDPDLPAGGGRREPDGPPAHHQERPSPVHRRAGLASAR